MKSGRNGYFVKLAFKKGSAMEGQIDFETFLEQNRRIFPACANCVCRACLLWWSKRCPYGECYDDKRATEDPYDRAHPGKPPRKLWSQWSEPGEQAHWCRGGALYPVRSCQEFIKYWGCEIKECIGENVQVFQDGYIVCSIVNTLGCEWCYEQFNKKEF